MACVSCWAAFNVIEVGVRTGPMATMLTFFLELVKVSSPATLARPAYAAAGWIVWPLRYMDLWLYRRPAAHMLANSIYALVRKREAAVARPGRAR